ncbi:hypothetical protein ACOMHN_045379 [Nucella lapillus]
MKRGAVCPLSLSMLIITVCCPGCRGWVKDASQSPTPPPCPPTCNCSLSHFPFFATSLFTVKCGEVEGVTWSVVTCNATRALLLSHSHVLHLLDLSANTIACSDCRQFFQRMGLLIHLNLSRNAIQTLRNDTFSGLGDLEVLDLSFNSLSVIEPQAFRGLRQVSVLRLDHNQLFEVKRSWLTSLPWLHELYLQGNHLSDVAGYTFTHTQALLHLDLSSNALRTVSDNGFLGLGRVKTLNMSYTDLLIIPTQELQRLSSLAILLLDGIALTALQPGDFSQLAVSSLSLSFLPHLVMVRQGAFSNLTQLRTLQMHDNYQLRYIHPQAFAYVPLLHRLLLHNNQLVTLSAGVRDSLPSLDELHLYHNPLHCDCNLFWLRQDMLAADDYVNGSVDTYVRHWDRLLCSSPDAASRADLKHVALHLLPPSCSPTSLPFFADTYHVTVGDEVLLRCQALGVPQPSLSWVLPGGRVVNGSTDSRHVVSLDSSAITIPGVRLRDQGTYSCRADNALGFDTSSTVVHVHNKDLRLSMAASSSTTVTVTWTGSVPRHQMWHYHLQYWQSGADNASQRLELDSRGTNCTLRALRPLTAYHVCVVFREAFTVHCLNVSTARHVLLAQPSRSLGTVSSTAVSVCVVIVLVVTLYAARVVKRRRRRRQKSKDSDSLAEDKEMDRILLEPIDQRVPDSPQCTPRTALLPKSYV